MNLLNLFCILERRTDLTLQTYLEEYIMVHKETEDIQHEFNQATQKQDPCELFLESLDSETLSYGEKRAREVWE